MVKGLATGNRARAYVALATAGCTSASCGCSRSAHERDGSHTHGWVAWSEDGRGEHGSVPGWWVCGGAESKWQGYLLASYEGC